MHVLLVSTASLHPWCAFAAFLCAEITMGTCVFCAACSISCIHHIHGDGSAHCITLLGTCVCVGIRACVFCLRRPLIGTELIKSVFERVNCVQRLSGSGHDFYRRFIVYVLRRVWQNASVSPVNDTLLRLHLFISPPSAFDFKPSCRSGVIQELFPSSNKETKSPSTAGE